MSLRSGDFNFSIAGFQDVSFFEFNLEIERQDNFLKEIMILCFKQKTAGR